MKVHRAQLQMVREWSAKLRNLGVPFFGTNSSLVIPFGKGEVTPGDGGRKLEKGMIHEGDREFALPNQPCRRLLQHEEYLQVLQANMQIKYSNCNERC